MVFYPIKALPDSPMHNLSFGATHVYFASLKDLTIILMQ